MRLSTSPIQTRRRSGFTLIELLVVIAIIAILAAILFPVFAQAREKARQTSCLSNLKQLGLGIIMYTQDYDETYPTYFSYAPTVNGGTTTLQTWDQLVLPYLKNYQIFACPSDTLRPQAPSAFAYKDGNLLTLGQRRSYHYPAGIYTVQSGANIDANTSLSGASLASIDQASDTVLLPEIWTSTSLGGNSSYVGSYSSSVFIGCDIWKLAGRVLGSASPQEQLPPTCSGYLTSTYTPTKGHSNGSNYAMADGSAKFRTWGNIRQNDFFLFKKSKPTTTVTP